MELFNIHRLKRGFTLMEIMIVLAILGVLISALIPGYNSYIQRGRDAARASDVDDIAKSVIMYFTEHDQYPPHTLGCVNYVVLANYMLDGTRYDPLPTHYNGCGTNRHYGYAMSTGILNNPNVFSLLAIMEQAYGGNYAGSLDGFTGTMTAAAYNTGLTLLVKGAGAYYIRVP